MKRVATGPLPRFDRQPGRVSGPPRRGLFERILNGAWSESIDAVWVAFAIGLAAGGYFVLRYLGNWAETDSANFSMILTFMGDHHRLDYRGAYSHGYAYTVWASTLSELIGLPVTEFTRILAPLIGNVFLALFGYAAFRRWLGSDRLGLLAASVLFLVPEVVFTVSRGNHEKLTVTLSLLASLYLINAFNEILGRNRRSVYRAWILVYYLTIMNLVSLNSVFGSTFVVATSLSLFFAIFLVPFLKRGDDLRKVIQRLTMIVGTSLLFLMLVFWFIYPQEGGKLNLLSNALSSLNTVAETGNTASNPYVTVTSWWVSDTVFQVISSFRWFLLGGSFLTWLVLAVRTFARIRKASITHIFLVALYGSFAIELALSVPLDFLGLDAGSNFQVRIYTYFAIFAVPLLVLGVTSFLSALPKGVRPLGTGLLQVAMVVFLVISLGKATLDPAISNRWIFYDPAEVVAMRTWALHHTDRKIGIGQNVRLMQAYRMHQAPVLPNRNTVDIGRLDPETRHLIRSEIISTNYIATQTPAQDFAVSNRVYDNGSVQILHQVPATPFQR